MVKKECKNTLFPVIYFHWDLSEMRGFYLNVCFGSVMLLREQGLVVFETYWCGVVVG